MNEMVTIPREDYERLLQAAEDLADIQTANEIIHALKTGETEEVPSEFVNRMIEGESLLKLWREHRGLSQAELSRRSGVNRVQIINIEKDGKTGSIETLKKLAQTLNVQIDDLV